MELSAKVAKVMVSGVWHLTFEEMETVLDMVQHGIDKSREGNYVSEQNSIQKNDKGCL